MKLYYSPGACSLAPHIILREAGQDVTLEKVDLREKTTETGADFWGVNPKGYVPVLQLPDGGVLTEGVVIQQYIADRAPDAGLAPPRGSLERMRLDELQVYISTELHKTFSPLFAATTPDDAKPAFREKIAKRLDLMEKLLADGRPYLTGDSFTIADAYLFVMTNWCRPTGIDLDRWPNLAAFAERVSKRPAVKAAMQAEGLAAKN